MSGDKSRSLVPIGTFERQVSGVYGTHRCQQPVSRRCGTTLLWTDGPDEPRGSGTPLSTGTFCILHLSKSLS